MENEPQAINMEPTPVGRRGKRKSYVESDGEPEMLPEDETSKMSIHEEYKEKFGDVEEDDEDDSEEGVDDSEGEVDVDVDVDMASLTKPNKMSDCGTVKKIECTDFMCHKELTVSLGPKINFITGQNGSGKSAVIAALQICLGMNAKETHRGSKLKNLIRHGSHGNATVRVVLNNNGQDSHKQDVYGPEIIIERVIRRVGGSGYKLLSAEGRTVSTKKSDVDAVIEHFNLFVNNPCCILDQENSKLFLKGNSKDKYNLFLKATELEKMIKNYGNEKAYRDRAKQELKEKGERIPQLEKDVEQAKRELEDLNQLDQLQDRRVNLMRQRVWAIVKETEVTRDNAAAVEAKARKKKDRDEATVKSAEEAQQEKAKEGEVISEQVKETLAKLDVIQADLKRKSEEIDMRSAPKKGIEKEVRTAKLQVNAYLKQKEDLQEEIAELHERAVATDKESEKAHLLDELHKAEQQKASLEAKYNSSTKELDELVKQKDSLQDEAAQAKNLLEQSNRKLKEQKRELEDLEATKSDNTARFGNWLPGLLALIRQNKKNFHREPLHVGLNVELVEKDYWVPVEKHLGNQLTSFLVCDPHDKSMLQKLAKRAKARVKILVCKFLDKRHGTKSVDSRLMTIEKAIKTKNDNVFNALVDFAQIEGQVLVKTPEDAMRETFLGPKGKKHMPQNMLACYDKDGTKFTVKKNSESKVANNSNTRQSRYFSTDVSAQIEGLKRSITSVEYEASKHKEEWEARKVKMKECQTLLKKLERKQQEYVNTQSKLEGTIHTLTQKQAENDGDDDAVALADKKENLQELTSAIEKQQEKLAAAEERLKKFEEQLAPLEEAHRKEKQKFNTVNSDVERTRKRLTNFEEELSPLTMAVVKATSRVKISTEKLAVAEEELKKAIGEYEKSEKGALTFCKGERVEPTATQPKLLKQISIVQKEIEKEKKLRDKSKIEPAVLIERARAKFKRAEANLENRKREQQVVKRRLKNLRKSAKARMTKWKDFKGHTQRITSRMFDFYLSQRNHRGTVNFDDDAGEINFTWAKSAETHQEPAEGANAYTDTRQLSGGEKSFTTLAFLLAMGKVVECPFRVMDEFDVFMDAGNRKTAMDLLVEMARDTGTSTKQFIFITPNDISMVSDAADVRKLRMRPPAKEYGAAGNRVQQTTLRFKKKQRNE